MVPWWKEAAPVWQNLEGNGETEGDRGGSETQQEGRETNRTCQSGPHDERRHLVKPVHGSHRQMLCFFYDNGRAAKKLAASRSFEQRLTLKLSLGFTPELVPPRHTHKGLVAPSFNAGCMSNARHKMLCKRCLSGDLLFISLCLRLLLSAALHVGIRPRS